MLRVMEIFYVVDLVKKVSVGDAKQLVLEQSLVGPLVLVVFFFFRGKRLI